MKGFFLSWTFPICFFKCCIQKASYFHDLRQYVGYNQHSFMNFSNMYLQFPIIHKASITGVAFKRLLLFMNFSNMILQITILHKASITGVAFERLLLFMNFSNMFLQITTLHKASITRVAFKRLILFMNWLSFIISNVAMEWLVSFIFPSYEKAVCVTKTLQFLVEN